MLGVHSMRDESGARALWDAFLVSLSAIHGRTTFEQLGAWSPAAWVAAVESGVGIVIEGVFVAMLVQRFFGGREQDCRWHLEAHASCSACFAFAVLRWRCCR